MKKLFLSIMLFTLTACAVTPPAQSVDARLAYSLAAITAARTGAADAVIANTITVAQAGKVLAATDDARELVDVARAAHLAGNDGSALGTLAQVAAILAQVQVQK